MDDALRGAAAAVVASPTIHHLEHVRSALEHGCHVLVEKPVAASLEGVDRLLDLAERTRRILAVAMNLRFHPGPVQVKEIVTSGVVGRPLTAHFTFGYHLPSWRPGTDYTQAYSARSELGGGVLLDVIHEFDYASWLLGPVAEVSGWAQRISGLQIDVEDVALVNARFASGAVGSFSLDYLDRSYRRGCWVVGQDASVRWSWRDEVVELLSPDGKVERRPAPSAVDDSYVQEMGAFVAAVRAGSTEGSRLVDGREGLRALAVVEAVRQSAVHGGSVRAVPQV
jgi:predicted dehydrogenase